MEPIIPKSLGRIAFEARYKHGVFEYESQEAQVKWDNVAAVVVAEANRRSLEAEFLNLTTNELLARRRRAVQYR